MAFCAAIEGSVRFTAWRPTRERRFQPLARARGRISFQIENW